MSGVPSWAVPGAMVVCVDDRLGAYLKTHIRYVGGLDGLTAGRVYTIWSVYWTGSLGHYCLELAEIERPCPSDTQPELGFCIYRFRPLTSTDNEVETRLYRTKGHDAPVREDA